MIHIEGIASQDMTYLMQFFAFVNTDFNVTKVIPSFKEEWAYINKFGIKKIVNGEVVVGGQYKKIFPYTIILPKGLNVINQKIVDWSSVKEEMIRLQEKDAKIKEFFISLTPEEK